MRLHHLLVLLILLGAMAIVLGACAQPTPQVIEKPVTVVVEKQVAVEKQVVSTVVVEKQVLSTVVVEKEVVKVVTATPPPPTPTPTPPTIRMYFVPSTEADVVLASGKQIAELLEKRTGYKFEVAVPTSYAAVIEALCADKADVAWLATFAYVLANQRCGVEARLTTVRFGLSTYRAQIITLSDAEREKKGLKPIKTLEDLNGAKFAFTDPVSTSGNLFPRAMLLDAGVKLGEEIFAGGHPQVVLAVYNGDVDAGATFWSPIRPDGTIGDARRNVMEQYPDVEQRVKILRLSNEIPNDTVSFRKTLPQEYKDRIVTAILEMAKTPEGVDLLGKLYNITGLVPAVDSDYDVVRRMGETLGFDFSQAIK